MNALELMCCRKSHRAYLAKPVEEEKIEKVVIAAGLAPLGLPRTGKPHLTVVTNAEVLKELAYCGGSDRDMIYGAPCLIIVSTPEYPAPGIDYCNAGCVVENMALEATDLGLGSIYLYGVTAKLAGDEALMKKLAIPAGMKPVSALAMGYGEEEIRTCKEMVEHLTMNRI